ncbi:putative glutathione S-transferase [Sphingomonas changbaiensis NBRC 104936]|uniref:Putative glutathione S-transferase n=1 Tax=Sphingomonas changbaiensis NBRC 104936 TaxID=1219043 RepID=A0A0E9MQF9_9SPHN|nr:glutathione S-transferase N-terminal domain-containing protein [Sphingomonas changbaiensis]GAO39992.1 putative glutathione S-transferase [Sphingomonas changbaiensis NBRC 104936]
MKVYGSIASPFVQRVLMAGRIKGHDLPVELPPGGSMQAPEFLAISPMGRVPVLDDDGWTLAESAAIVGYLDDVLDGPPLLPENPRDRARARTIETLASHELAGLRPIMVCKVFGMRNEPVLVDEAISTIRTGLAALEKARDANHVWAAGDSPTVADCILVPLFSLMDVIDPIAGTSALVAEQPGLAGYRERAFASELGGRTVREMRDTFAAILERRRQPAQQSS